MSDAVADIVVLGTGGAGLAAAITGHDGGEDSRPPTDLRPYRASRRCSSARSARSTTRRARCAKSTSSIAITPVS